MSELFPPLPKETRLLLDRLPGLIEKVFPLPARFRSKLPADVAHLSQLLTSHRADLENSYLRKPALLSAYLRYFFPWNIYRLCRLCSALPLNLKAQDAINDIGSGPFTLAASLWISKPSLRKLPLEFRCLDRTPAALEAGKLFFAALSAESGCKWTFRTIRGELKHNGRLSVEIKGKSAALSAAVNIYNELFWDFSPMDTERLLQFSKNQARLLSSITDSSGAILVVEPGIPRSGEFISLLRSFLMKEGRYPLSPCPHSGACPIPGGKKGTGRKERWCHFAFDTEDAPLELHKLSSASRLPKERAVLSFIFAGPMPGNSQEDYKVNNFPVRVISDSFPVNAVNKSNTHNWGRYGCSEPGLVLIKGSKQVLEKTPSGTLKNITLKSNLRDLKSGAFIGEL